MQQHFATDVAARQGLCSTSYLHRPQYTSWRPLRTTRCVGLPKSKTIEAVPVRHLHGKSRLHATSSGDVARSRADLWDYEDSFVRTLDLKAFRLLHQQSYSHRNRRTVVLVVYDPQSAACRNVEHEIERLASGLAYEPRIVVTKLNTARKEAWEFARGVLEVKQLPSVFLYPEASPGFMRLKGHQVTAEGLLAAVNGCYRMVLPNRDPLELLPVSSSSGSGGAAAQPAAAVAAASVDAAAGAADAAAADTAAAGSTSRRQRRQQQQVAADALPARPPGKASSYWSRDKQLYWGAILVLGVLTLLWESRLAPLFELEMLKRREAQRAAGAALDSDTNAEDLFRIVTMRLEGTMAPFTGEEMRQAEVGTQAASARGLQPGRPEAEVLNIPEGTGSTGSRSYVPPGMMNMMMSPGAGAPLPDADGAADGAPSDRQ